MAVEKSIQELVLQYTFDVTTADCDTNGRLRPGGLVNFLVLAAINSAETLGFGYDGLREQKLFWVLSRMTVELVKPLHWRDKAVVETWPKDVTGLLYLRDFIVRDQHNEIVARATSGWLAIDLQTKRPRKVDEKFSYIFNSMREKHAMVELPEKLGGSPVGYPYEVKVTWFDLDVNKHVTSSRYIDWMFDCLPFEFLKENYPKKLSINYLKETMMGEKILVSRSSNENNDFLIEGIGRESQTPKFRGNIIF